MKKTFIAIALANFLLILQANAQLGQAKFIDPANMDLAAKPGDDFNAYANGTWLRNNPVPAKETRWGSFNQLRDFNINAVKKILEDAAKDKTASTGTVKRRVADFYSAGIDTVAIEKAGFNPIKGELAKLNLILSPAQLLNQLAYMQTNGLRNPLFSIRIAQDRKNVEKMMVHLGGDGLTMADRDYYLKTDARTIGLQNVYKEYISKLFQLIGTPAAMASKNAEIIFNLEKQLAAVHYTRVESRDPYKSYNKFFVADFANTAPDLNLKNYLASIGLAKQDTVIVSNPKFFTELNAMMKSVPLNDWKTYLKFCLLHSAAPYLSKAFVNANFEYDKAFSGQKVQTPRWQIISQLTDNSIGELLGQLYVAEYFKPEAKKRMDIMIENLRKAFAIRINNLEWMGADTKKKALAKLAAFNPKIGYPAKWETYNGLNITKNNFYQNIRNVSKWRFQDNLSKLGKPVDRTKFGMTPPTVNAYYNATLNEIVFPAGILQFPFFHPDADDALNYGGIGAVIGHEMSHGFDDQGSKYDADGTLRNWWTDDDRKKFEQRTNLLAAQFDGYKVVDTIPVNGKLTLGENIGDLGGLNAAFEAYKMTDEFKQGKTIDGFTPTQRFFLSWAQVWRANTLPETAAKLVMTDNHSPAQYRVIGPIVNMDEWYNAFDVKPGDRLYKKPEDRIKIW